MHSIPLPTYATYLPTYPTYPTHPTHPTYPTPYDPRIKDQCSTMIQPLQKNTRTLLQLELRFLRNFFLTNQFFFGMHENTNLGDTDTDTDTDTGKQIPNSIENCTCILGCPVLLESERPPATLTGPLERGGRSISTGGHMLKGTYAKRDKRVNWYNWGL
jgi:hypothetical protein